MYHDIKYYYRLNLPAALVYNFLIYACRRILQRVSCINLHACILKYVKYLFLYTRLIIIYNIKECYLLMYTLIENAS